LKSSGNPGCRSVNKRGNPIQKTKLHHIGIVVADISETAKAFKSIGLYNRTRPESDPIQRVSASFIDLIAGQDIFIELVEPTDESSPVTKFLKSRGGGLHHLCFEVHDLEKVSANLVNDGFRMVTAPVKCQGFDKSFVNKGGKKSKIAFFLTQGKLLIELLERN